MTDKISIIGAGMTGWWSGFLLGLGGFWFLMALLSHRALLNRFPWLPAWAPFLDPTGAFATADQLTGKFIAGHSFRITEIVHDSLISNRTFDDCDIYGPAVIALSGVGQVAACSFDAPPEQLVITVTQEKAVGAIKVVDCNFKNCRFHNVSFIGTQELFEKISAGMADTQGQDNNGDG